MRFFIKNGVFFIVILFNLNVFIWKRRKISDQRKHKVNEVIFIEYEEVNWIYTNDYKLSNKQALFEI